MSELTIKVLHEKTATNQAETIFKLDGNLDNSTVATLEGQLNKVLEAKAAVVVFDLAGLKLLTSVGIRLFLLAAKKQKAHQGRLSFINLQPQIKEVFDIMGSIPDMQIFANQAELDAYLLARQRTYDS